MLRISFVARPEFIEAMRRKGPRIVQVLMSSLSKSMFKLASYVQTQKLSGQVLTPRTGTLRASVTAIPAHLEGAKIVGAVEMAAGPGFYGKWHEVGTSRAYVIAATKGRALSFVMGGKRRFFASIIHPEIKKRAFAAPSLAENAEKIVADLNAAIAKVIDEK